MRELDFNLQVILSPKEQPHKHMSCEAILVLKGGLDVSLEGNLSRLEKDDILFIGTEKEHFLSGRDDESLVCTLKISPEVCWHLTGVFCDSTKISDPEAFSKLRRIFRQLLSNRQSGGGHDDYLQLSLCYRFLHILQSYFRTEQQEDDVVLQLKQYIFRNYRDEISLQTMADHFHFSIAYLSRMFKKKIGENFLSYLNSLRTERAAEEILYTDKGITAIAMEQGFSSLSSFYKQFGDRYGLQPQEYRKIYAGSKNASDEANGKSRKLLREYLDLEKPEKLMPAGFEHNLILDAGQKKHSRLNMTGLINIGLIRNFSSQSVRDAVHLTGKSLGSRYLRAKITMNDIQGSGKPDLSGFSVLESFLQYCSQNRMIPYLVLLFDDEAASGDPASFVASFNEFIDSLIWEAVMSYSSDLAVCFELNRRGNSMAPAQKEYMECFLHLKRQVSKYYPSGSTGGDGSAVSNFAGREADILTPWADAGILPDFFAVTLFSFARVSDRVTHRFSDSGSMNGLMERLNMAARELGMDEIPVYVTEFDSFRDEYNYLNDSRWKACFLLKTYAECLDKASLLGYIKLKDHRVSAKTDLPFYGGNGMLSVDNLPKPAYNALRSLRGFGQDILFAGNGCILSKVTPFRYRAVLYNYKELNELFYLKNSNEIAPEDLYLYIGNQENDTFHIELTGLEDGEYQVNTYITNEQFGSALDAWIKKGCPDSSGCRSDWLSNYAVPDICSSRTKTESGVLRLDFVLAPLDFIGLEIFMTRPSDESGRTVS